MSGDELYNRPNSFHLAGSVPPSETDYNRLPGFHTVYEQKPADSLLTSFSVLMAGYKGDIHYYIEGASAIDCLTPQSRVLIAEACTHAPATEDIGRVKLPRMLRKR